MNFLIKNYCQIIIKNSATKTKVRKITFLFFKKLFTKQTHYIQFSLLQQSRSLTISKRGVNYMQCGIVVAIIAHHHIHTAPARTHRTHAHTHSHPENQAVNQNHIL